MRHQQITSWHVRLSLLGALALLLSQLNVSQVYAAAQGEKEARQLAQLKQQVAKRVADKKTNVKIKLRDGTEVKGQIQQVAAENFVVLNKATGGETTIAYHEVANMRGQGLSKGAKIAVTTAIVVGAVMIGLVSILYAGLN